jgi:hypothetical protein
MIHRVGLTVLAIAVCGCARLDNASAMPRRDVYRSEHRAICTAASGYPGRDYRWVTLRDTLAIPDDAYVKAVSSIVLANAEAARECYRKASDAWPGLQGRVKVALVIEPDGSVGRSQVVESTVCPKELGCCIANAIRSLQLPKPPQPRPTAVVFPYLLVRPDRVRDAQDQWTARANAACVP